ncbi:cupin domain-containing protein [Noviherbaspirillum pedocola]|uniref:Phosphoribosylaminoimidazole carboxylase n=1 Tax=Noviherbaspirillum pedocola TaxID=2801341 RepID=A0A934T0A6_9BURK|nr:phosphoribosylaminoimidazole carboxylase [Noviherbaspirillum pedocola]MBK4738321.1 phosphoribosylaminoimidazole carboxylase [Noviherbaspirillum pedocola]
MNNGHFFQNLPSALPEEIIEVLIAHPSLRIERIVSHGQHSPDGFWYDQDEHEWVMLLAGAARLGFADGRMLEMTPGCHVLIAAHERHRVEWTAPDADSIWLAVFYRDG